ncbi:MAG TPA: polysaccharide biosynthesis C-terminal domain-containing protein, partial [Acidimicrobiales bacterium]|nr:polysaccharide biosynthesis C-terminal domain-containing protein [Acidimicrobiales bacterium]
ALADAGSAVIMTAMVWHVTAGSTRPVETGRFVLARMGPLGLATGLVVIYYRVDLWLLALLRGTGDVARYGSAYRVLDGVLLAAAAVATLSVPAVARAAAGDQQRIVKRLVLLSLVITLPLTLVGLVGAAPIMGGLFGARYAQASGLLRLLLVAAVPSAVVTVLAPLAVLRGRGTTVRGLVVALVADVGLNLALVPSLGAAGAAWATLACQAVLAAWLLYSVLRWSTPGGPTPSFDGSVAEVQVGHIPVAEVPVAEVTVTTTSA